MVVEKISSEIFRFKNLVLKINIKPPKEGYVKDAEFVRKFTYNNKDFVSVNFQPFITMDIRSEVWEHGNSILISCNSIYQIIKMFNLQIENIYKEKIFAISKSNKVIIYADKIKPNSVSWKYSTQSLSLEPTIYYDENEICYEGVRFFINRKDNYIDMPIDVLESLYYCLKRTDIYGYGLNLLNIYINSLEKGVILEREKTDTNIKRKSHVLLEGRDNKSNINTKNEEFFKF